MKIAFVHCRIQPGGALNVFEDIIARADFSDAKVFTLYSDQTVLSLTKETTEGEEEMISLPIVTALPRWINNFFVWNQRTKLPILHKLFDYRNLIVLYPPLMRILSRKIKKFHPDHLSISSFAVAKNIDYARYKKTTKRPTIDLYLHSPMQYIWSHYDHYVAQFSGLTRRLFTTITPGLRKRDAQFTSYDTIKTNSHYIAGLAHDYYGISQKNISVNYPRINNEFFFQTPVKQPHDYFVYVGRLAMLVKEVDLLVNLCNETGEKLVIIGSGPDEAYLKSIAGDTITFVGRIHDLHDKIDIIRQSRGILNLTKESFGIVTAESLLLGVPVFGLNDGGSKELVDEASGVLVDDTSSTAIRQGFEQFRSHDFDRKIIHERARKLFR